VVDGSNGDDGQLCFELSLKADHAGATVGQESMQIIMELDVIHELAVCHCQDKFPDWF